MGSHEIGSNCMQSPQEPQAELKPLLTAQDVATLLAISPRNLEYLIAKGDAPPHFMVGRLRRWRPADVQAWISARAHQTPQQP